MQESFDIIRTLNPNTSEKLSGQKINGYLVVCKEQIDLIGTIKSDELNSANMFLHGDEETEQALSNASQELLFKKDHIRDMVRQAKLADLSGLLLQLDKTICDLKRALEIQGCIESIKIESLISHITAIHYYLWYFNKNSVHIKHVLTALRQLYENGNKIISPLIYSPQVSDKPVGDDTTKQPKFDVLTHELRSYQEQHFLNKDEHFDDFLRRLWELSLSHHTIQKKIFISYAWPVESWTIYLLKENQKIQNFLNKKNIRSFALILVGEKQTRKVFFLMERELLKSGNELVEARVELSQQEAEHLSPHTTKEVELNNIPANMPTLIEKLFHLTERPTKNFVDLLALHLVYAGFIVYHDLITEPGGALNDHMDKILNDTDIVLVISTRTYVYKRKDNNSGVSCEYRKIIKRIEMAKRKEKKPLIVIPVLLNDKNYCPGDLPQRVEIRFNNTYVEPLKLLLTKLYEFSPIPQAEVQKQMSTLFEEFIHKQEIVGHAKQLIANLRPEEKIPEKLKINLSEIKQLIESHKNLIIRKNALENAMQHGSIEVIIILLTIVNIKWNPSEESKSTLFHLAAYYDRHDVLDLLFRHFPSDSLNKIIDITPAHVAIKKDHLNSLKIILAYLPATIFLNDALGNSLLHYATKHNAVKCALHLENLRVDLKVKNNAGLSALAGEENASLKERLFVEREKSKRMQSQSRALVWTKHQGYNCHINVVIGESILSMSEYVKCELLLHFLNPTQNLSLPFTEYIEQTIKAQQLNKDILALYAIQYTFSWHCNFICNFDVISELVEDNSWMYQKSDSGLNNAEDINSVGCLKNTEINSVLKLLFNLCILGTNNFFNGMPAAYWAAKYNSVRVLKFFHETCPNELEYISARGENLLHVAAKNTDPKALDYLLTVLPRDKQHAEDNDHRTYRYYAQETAKDRLLQNKRDKKSGKEHVELMEDEIPEDILKERGDMSRTELIEEQKKAHEQYQNQKRRSKEEVSKDSHHGKSDSAKKHKSEDTKTLGKFGIHATPSNKSKANIERKDPSFASRSLK